MLLTKCEVNMAGYWPRAFFAFLRTDTKSRSIKRPPNRGYYPAILTEQRIYYLEKSFDSLRIKNDMFISRDGKESHLESLACFSTLIVFYRFTLPPTLSKNYELFFKFAPMNFLSCTGSQRYISSGHDGLILIARLADQNIGFASYWQRVLSVI